MMTKRLWVVLGAGLSIVVGIALFVGLRAMMTTPDKVTADSGSQVSDAGGVQVTADYRPADQAEGTIVLSIALSTHSVELGAFDLAKLSRVVLEPGGTVTEITWTPKGASAGHHVEGTLTARAPVALTAVNTVVLEIEGLASPKVRRFEWPTGVR